MRRPTFAPSALTSALLVLLAAIALACNGDAGDGDQPTVWEGAIKKRCGIPTQPPFDGKRNRGFGEEKYWHAQIMIMVDEYRRDDKGKRHCQDASMSLPFHITLSGQADDKPGVKFEAGIPLPWSASVITPHYEHVYVMRIAKRWHVKVTATYVLPTDLRPSSLRFISCAIWVDNVRVDWQTEPTGKRARVECLHLHS